MLLFLRRYRHQRRCSHIGDFSFSHSVRIWWHNSFQSPAVIAELCTVSFCVYPKLLGVLFSKYTRARTRARTHAHRHTHTHILVWQSSGEHGWLLPPPLSSWRLRPYRLQISRMVVAPCLTMKPQPDWSLVNEQSVCVCGTIRWNNPPPPPPELWFAGRSLSSRSLASFLATMRFMSFPTVFCIVVVFP